MRAPRSALVPSLAAVLLAGCAQTWQELGAFNCPEDHSCPEGLACVLLNGNEECVPKASCDLFTKSSCQGITSDGHPRARCTLMTTNPGLVETQCVEQYGSSPEGTACAILYSQNPGLGSFGVVNTDFPVEDRFCDNGSLCYGYAMSRPPVSGATTAGICRRYCKLDGDCASGQRCLDGFNGAVTTATLSVSPRPGVCYPACTLLPKGASDCGSGEQCTIALTTAPNTGMGLCQTPNNNAAAGAQCGAAYPCALGSSCLPVGNTFQCQKMCRISAGAVPCGAGKTCKASTITLSDADIGFCG